MLFVLPFWVTTLAVLSVVALALVRGGWIERLVGALTLASFIWARSGVHVFGVDLRAELTHDLIASVVMTGIAIRANRYWTLAAASTWVVSVITECAQLAAPVNVWTYGTAELVWYYLFLCCLAWGAWRAPRYQVAPIGRRLSE